MLPVAGALGGLAIGTMIGSAASRDKGSSRAEQAAIRAEDKAENVQKEQERQRISKLEHDLERKELERKLETLQRESTKSPNNIVFFLYILVSILLLSVVGLAVVFFKRKP